MKMKLTFIICVAVLISSGSAHAEGYAKPDQWGSYHGVDKDTGEKITAKPDDWGGYRGQKGDKKIQMKPDKWGGYDCKEYDKNYKQVDSYKLKPDGYGGYRSNKGDIHIRKDKWGVYKW
jgi:hypothetical protein